MCTRIFHVFNIVCFWDWYRMTRKRDTFLSLSYLFLHVLRSGETFFLSYSVRVCSKKDFVRSCSDHEQDLLTPEVLRGALTSTFFAVIFLDSRDELCRKGGRTWNLVLVQKCFEYKIFISHHELFFWNKTTTAKTEQPIFSHGIPEIQRYPLIRPWTAQELAKHDMKSHGSHT